MNKFMHLTCLTTLLVLTQASAPAAQEGSSKTSGDVCIERVKDYWAAFSRMDADAAVAMQSSKGTYSTNSDGSFHKPVRIMSVEEMKENLSNYSGLWSVYYPEAILLSEDVVLTRYYLEGLTKSGEGTKPYRTRVTHIWVNEDGKWLTRSWHFSPANYGDVHVTQPSDFKKE